MAAAGLNEHSVDSESVSVILVSSSSSWENAKWKLLYTNLQNTDSNADSISAVTRRTNTAVNTSSLFTVKNMRFQAYRNAALMVEFSIALIGILDQLNRDSFQSFQLRIGECLNFSAICNANRRKKRFRNQFRASRSWCDWRAKAPV